MSALQYHAKQAPGIWHNNPALVQLLGLSPLLAVSTSLANGLALGLASLIVLLLASLTVALSQHLLSSQWRFVFYMFVLAVFTTLIDNFLQRFYYPLYRELGIYVPLISCNMALLLHLETRSLHKPVLNVLYSALVTGSGYLLAIVSFAAVRELLIEGQIASNWMLLMPATMAQDSSMAANNSPEFFHFARLAPAALILLGLLLALKNAVLPTLQPLPDLNANTPVKRARVTGKIHAP